MAESHTNPDHYTKSLINGVECIDVVRHFPFSTGNAIKYVWRAGLKGDTNQDLDKAEYYVLDAVDNSPAVTYHAKDAAYKLGGSKKVYGRNKKVVDFVVAIADKDYSKAQDIIDKMREVDVDGDSNE